MAAKDTEIIRHHDVALPLPGGEGQGEGERELYFYWKKIGELEVSNTNSLMLSNFAPFCG
ncbi:MAG: hypothetical protein ACLPRE_06030 [Limisphaerales bacterium]